ncbi:hypothetical protein DL768_006999 [Monosporascus sp. mg162]|nr:hypothetical protein DL768_006999 [Monosporascus sp. mg162]
MAKRKHAKTKKPKEVCYREPPAWYLRLMPKAAPWEEEVHPWDFDEDLSELHESEMDSDDSDSESDFDGAEVKTVDYKEAEEKDDHLEYDCDCEFDGQTPDCRCQTSSDYDGGEDSKQQPEEDEEPESEPESESEQSYNGSDAGWYYELKEARIERKRELRNSRKQEQRERRFLRKIHEEKENEVRAYRDALVNVKAKVKTGASKDDNDERRQRLDLINKTFTLYSAEYLDHCDFISRGIGGRDPSVEFYRLDREERGGEPSEIEGQITYLALDSVCQLMPFIPPEHAGPEAVVLGSSDRKHKLEFEFLDNDYLILRLGRGLVFEKKSKREKRPLPEPVDLKAEADVGVDTDGPPEIVEFVGIRYDAKKRRAEDERLQEAVKKTRTEPPSPLRAFLHSIQPPGQDWLRCEDDSDYEEEEEAEKTARSTELRQPKVGDAGTPDKDTLLRVLAFRAEYNLHDKSTTVPSGSAKKSSSGPVVERILFDRRPIIAAATNSSHDDSLGPTVKACVAEKHTDEQNASVERQVSWHSDPWASDATKGAKFPNPEVSSSDSGDCATLNARAYMYRGLPYGEYRGLPPLHGDTPLPEEPTDPLARGSEERRGFPIPFNWLSNSEDNRSPAVKAYITESSALMNHTPQTMTASVQPLRLGPQESEPSANASRTTHLSSAVPRRPRLIQIRRGRGSNPHRITRTTIIVLRPPSLERHHGR